MSRGLVPGHPGRPNLISVQFHIDWTDSRTLFAGQTAHFHSTHGTEVGVSRRSSLCLLVRLSDFFFPYTPPPPGPPYPDTPPPSHPREHHVGPFWGPFRVRLGVLGWVGVGSLRGGSVREKNIAIIGFLSLFQYHFKQADNNQP